MGLLDKMRGMREPVDGAFRVVACSTNSGGSVYQNCSFDGVVSAPGIPPTPVHHSSLATPTAKWPTPGMTLPVTVDRANPQRLKIHWDQVPTTRQLAQELAAQQAQQMSSTRWPPPTQPNNYGTEPGYRTPAPDLSALPPQVRDTMAQLLATAQANGMPITTTTTTTPQGTGVIGDPQRPLPGYTGGGLTPQEAAAATSGDPAALGLQVTTAKVLAAHQVQVPPGTPGDAPAGVYDLTVDVHTNPGYTTTIRIGFSTPAKRDAIATIGRDLPVLADPTHHDRIAIDTVRLQQ